VFGKDGKVTRGNVVNWWIYRENLDVARAWYSENPLE